MESGYHNEAETQSSKKRATPSLKSITPVELGDEMKVSLEVSKDKPNFNKVPPASTSVSEYTVPAESVFADPIEKKDNATRHTCVPENVIAEVVHLKQVTKDKKVKLNVIKKFTILMILLCFVVERLRHKILIYTYLQVHVNQRNTLSPLVI